VKETIIDNRTEINRLKAENARLKAQLKRVTNAGDSIISILCQYVPRTGAKYALMDWNAAKEGKGQP
jgi:hypothetical protein